MNLDKRLLKLESRIIDNHFLPVLFVDRAEEIEQYQDRLNHKTVIFIDDIPEVD